MESPWPQAWHTSNLYLLAFAVILVSICVCAGEFVGANGSMSSSLLPSVRVRASVLLLLG